MPAYVQLRENLVIIFLLRILCVCMLCTQVCMVALVGYACECVGVCVCLYVCRLKVESIPILLPYSWRQQFNPELPDTATQGLGTPSIVS